MENHTKTKKRLTETTAAVDRISALPDDLLCHILSFLHMVDVVPTSFLSRRWRYLWRSTPNLHFDEEEFYGERNIPKFINQCLLLHDVLKIQKFHVHLDLQNTESSDIDSWLLFAMKRGVEDLSLDFMVGFMAGIFAEESELYAMPNCLLDCKALKVLRLSGCCLKLPSAFYFRSLKKLILSNVILLDLDTTGCPLLEDLTLSRCNYGVSLSIHVPNQRLMDLTIIDDYDVHIQLDNKLVIHAPHLLSIKISGFLRCHYKLKNLSSLVEATLDFNDLLSFTNYDPDEYALMELLKGLGHAKTFKLCRWCIQILSVREAQRLEIPKLSATFLDLEINLSDLDMQGIICLLKNSRLKSLTINMSNNKKNVDIWSRIPDYVLDMSASVEVIQIAIAKQTKLKTVKISNFVGSIYFCGCPITELNEVLKVADQEITLVKVLLGCCAFLDKMIIQTNKMIIDDKSPVKSELLRYLTKKLLTVPRLSVTAEVHFS